jgi:hypothetical protein
MQRRGRRRELKIKVVRQMVGMRCLELRGQGYTVTQAAEIINGEFPNLHMSRMTVYRMGEEVLFSRPFFRQ